MRLEAAPGHGEADSPTTDDHLSYAEVPKRAARPQWRQGHQWVHGGERQP